jgi:hypothetical protein
MITFHYQWVKTYTKGKERLTCHEAYSTPSGLLAVNPVPIQHNADYDTYKMTDTDLKHYGVVEFKAIKDCIERYADEIEVPTIKYPDYYSEDIEDDGYDSKGRVIDLVDYIKRNR